RSSTRLAVAPAGISPPTFRPRTSTLTERDVRFSNVHAGSVRRGSPNTWQKYHRPDLLLATPTPGSFQSLESKFLWCPGDFFQLWKAVSAGLFGSRLELTFSPPLPLYPSPPTMRSRGPLPSRKCPFLPSSPNLSCRAMFAACLRAARSSL